MCTTYMAVASGFMISAAGNRDKTPWDRPVLRGREGVFLGLSGLVAVILGPKVMAGRAPVTRITDPRSRVQYDVGGEWWAKWILRLLAPKRPWGLHGVVSLLRFHIS